jgi:hypothetical protein
VSPVGNLSNVLLVLFASLPVLKRCFKIIESCNVIAIYRLYPRLRVFENRVLRRVFGPKKDEVTGAWRKLHNEEFSDLYSLPNIVLVKSRRMRWAGHVACMGEGCTGFWLGSLREGDHWGDPDVDGRIILRWIFRNWEGVVGTGWS